MTKMTNLRSVFTDKQKNYFKGIGPATVDKMFSAVSVDELLRLLDNKDEHGLAQIPGLTATMVLRLRQGYALYRPLIELACYLDHNGFSKGIATNVFQVWGHRAMEKIHSNPYRLLALASWEEVDALGLRRGPEFHPCRLVSAIEACMYKDYEEDKHTYIDSDNLFLATNQLIGCNKAQFDHGLDLALTTGSIISIHGNLQVPAVNLFERLIEKFLLNNTRTGVSEGVVRSFIDHTGTYKLLTLEQRNAVANALMNRFSAYYGRGGSGKTFTLSAIADGAEILLRKNVFLTAVSAKACRKMESETGRKAFTIAHLLHIKKKKDLFDSLIVIDEASMLSIVNFYQILKKVPASAGIVMLGDPNQIPSIEAGKLFYDIVRTKAVPIQELTENKRQDRQTDLQLREILIGKFPNFNDYTSSSGTGLYRVLCKSVEDSERKAVDLYRTFTGNGEDVQIISPLWNYPGGSDSINEKVHYELHHHQDYVKGTPVVWTKNMEVEGGIRLTNGSMGYVNGKGAPGAYLEVVFEVEGDVRLTRDEVDNHLEMAYALTVHKAQGSDWDTVVIVLPKSIKMVDRNMVYTALSRCRKRSIILYHDHAFVSRQVAALAAHERRRSLLFSGVL